MVFHEETEKMIEYLESIIPDKMPSKMMEMSERELYREYGKIELIRDMRTAMEQKAKKDKSKTEVKGGRRT